VTPETVALLTEIAKQGLLGTFVVIEGWIIYRLYLKNQDLQEARLNDAKAFTDKALQISDEVNQSVNKIADFSDKLLPPRR
jgi:hypothetical protein